MTKSEFDTWCEKNLNKLSKELSKKFPRSKETIWDDFSQFYELIIDKHIDTLNDPLGFLHRFIWNKHYRFFSNITPNTVMVNTKRIRIDLVEDYSRFENIAEDTNYNYTIDNHIWNSINKLPLDQRNLFQLYYIDDLSTREIAKILNCSHTGIAKQLNGVRQKIKEDICSYYLQSQS